MSLRRRSLAAACAGAVLVAGLALAALRRPLAERALRAGLGLDPALEVRELGLRGVTLAQLRAAGPDGASLAIDELELAWTPLGLAQARLEALRVRGLRAELPAWGGAGVGTGTAPGAALLWLRALDALAVEDARVRVGSGPAALAVEARLALARRGSRPLAGAGWLVAAGAAERAVVALWVDAAAAGGVRGRLRAGAASTGGPLRGSAAGWLTFAADAQGVALYGLGCPRLELALRGVDLAASVQSLAVRGQRPAGADASLTLRARGTSVRAGGARVELLDWRATASLATAGELRAELTGAALRDLAAPPRFAPLDAELTLQRAAGSPRLELALRAGSRAGLRLRGTGSHDLAQARGALEVVQEASGPGAGSGAAWLAELPPLAAWIRAARGELALAARADWSPAGAALELELAPQKLDLATPWAVLAGVEGRVRLRGPDPWRTPEPAQLRAVRVDAGLAASDARLQFALEPGGALAIQEASAALAGGRVSAAGRYAPGSGGTAYTVQVDAVDVGALLQRVELPGLTGSGALRGALPLVERAGVLEVRDGELAARGGVLQYRPSGGASGLGQRPDVQLAFDALRDFHYSLLRVRLNGALQGELRSEVYLEGSNPSFRQGQPVQFTLNLQARLADLLHLPTRGLPAGLAPASRDR